MAYLSEAVLKPGFVAFVDYFGRFSTPKLGGYIPLSIVPPNHLDRKPTEPKF